MSARWPTRSVLAAMAGVLAACGGGGDSTNPPPPPTVATVTVSDPPALIKINESTSLTATARDANGGTITGRTVIWAVDHADVASLTPAGASATIVGKAHGSAVVMATIDGKNGTVTVNVSTDSAAFPSTASVTVGSGGNSFDPNTVDVASGGTVTWSWAQGSVTHNVTFSSVPAAVSGGDIGDRSSGSDSRTFTVPGTYQYHCTIHAGMNGSVIVH